MTSTLRNLLAAAGASLVAFTAAAQDFPSRPIELVVPYAPGGSTDAMARIVAPKVSELLKVPVLVVNKPGASGVIAINYVLASTDGYKVAAAGNSNFGPLLAVGQKPPYAIQDAAGLGRAVVNPLLVVARKGRFANFEALLKEARDKPESLTFGSWGAKSPGHFYGELLAQSTGMKMRHIPFDGGSKAMLSAMGGHTDLAVVTIPTAKGNVKAGTLAALAITGDQRDPELPDVPTIRELGFAEAAYASFDGLVASARTPKEQLAVLRDAFAKALNDPKVKDELRKAGSEPGHLDGAQYETFMRSNLEVLKRVAARAGIEE
jgi:tripartite-type tricarboxylate transporter receptor subunit TctC